MSGMTTQTTHGWVPRDASFGMRLAMIRKQMQWNAKEAAVACGLPQNSWRDWEVNDARPRDIIAVARKIAERTGVDFYWLIDGRPGPFSGPGLHVTESDLLPQLDSNQQPAVYPSFLVGAPERSSLPAAA